MGRMVAATSTIVTLVPNAANTSANSTPTAPAPTTTIDAGAFSAISTSSLESTTFLSSARPACGSPFTREPVAITTAFFASCVSFLPSASVTVTFLPFSITPSPRIDCTLYFFIRKSTPLEFCALMARERFMAGPKSSVMPLRVMPCSAALPSFTARPALSSSDLAGMQPHSTQVPPSPSRSIMATCRPSWAQRMAQT